MVECKVVPECLEDNYTKLLSKW